MSELSDQIVERFFSEGVREIISCPGGRSAELLNSFVDHGSFKIESIYDERTAGFYALGRSMETSSPVVVLTTSGSAVGGLYPAVLEARYQKKGGSLILLTADRPREYRNTGAPQTINQIDFFKVNGVETVDLKEVGQVKLDQSVMHFNICLEDPNPVQITKRDSNFNELLVVASLRKSERDEIREAFKNYKGFLILEALSNLKEKDFPEATVIKYPELFFSQIPISSFSSVYRIGGVPVGKFWRSVDMVKSYYWESYIFPGAINCQPLDLETMQSKLLKISKVAEEVKDRLEVYESLIEETAFEQVDSEISLLQKLSNHIPEGSRVFLGNSLPIREWEYCHPERFENFGQRGVNGIDGSLAFFLGQISSEKENWIILGDVTTLYNINDFQILKKLKNKKIRLVVVNNSGGQIFSRIFKKNKEFFVNPQVSSFEKLADFCDLGYVREITKVQLPLKVLIEINPDNKSSDKLWEEWKAIEF